MKRSLIINSGGKSSRLIKDFKNLESKSLLEFNNEPILVKNINTFSPFVNEILIIVKNEYYNAL